MEPHKLTNVTAAILGGGLGTRLRSVVADRPKVIAEVGNKPFLAYLLEQLANVGVKKVVICTGYLGEQIKTTFGDSYGNLELIYSQEQSQLGTAGALRLALPLLASDSVLVLNGDSYCDTNLNDFCSWHLTKGAEATLLLTQVSDTKRYGRVQVDEEGQLLSFAEKVESSGPGWINAGVYLFKRNMLLTIPENRPVSLEKELFPNWLGRSFYGYCTPSARFLDIGTPESYSAAVDFLKKI
ncbi:nucleotidyltransferase family protein [Dapis sp. BLCC M126]|uniref:nucleotidyltransferase family protein n=1 Tax=Dapis sp. BLCC M126 TaxID=3400189 RepID=UPI003CEB8993